MKYQKTKKIKNNNNNKAIQRQLQMRMMNKQLKKDIYIQKKDRKLLIILVLI